MDRAWDPLWTFAIAAVVVAVVAFLTVTTPPMQEFGVSQMPGPTGGERVLAIVLVIPPFLLVGSSCLAPGQARIQRNCLVRDRHPWCRQCVRWLVDPYLDVWVWIMVGAPCWFCSQFATARCSPSFCSWCWFASRRASPRRTSVHCADPCIRD